MNKISADLTFTNDGIPLKNAIVVYDDRGEILDIIKDASGYHDVRRLKGVITPGFINSHCHLELSHLKGKIPTGTGLIPFIKSVVSMRSFPMDEILDAIEKADREMWSEGIVAVGDISNKSDTAVTKDNSDIAYYTFVEMFDFLQEQNAESSFDEYQSVFESQSLNGLNKKSLVPHSPYSVSPRLFQYVNSQNLPGETISIHNQETEHENRFFKNGTGALTGFYRDFGVDLPPFIPTNTTSLEYALSQIDPVFKTLLVHNTMSETKDIQSAHRWSENVFWVTCPNANLYIENRLPGYKNFVKEGARICIGTDSLSSNWQLSILEEMKTITRYQSDISNAEVIRWATSNGAEALGYQNVFGTLKVGKSPGINWLETRVIEDRFDLLSVDRVQKIC